MMIQEAPYGIQSSYLILDIQVLHIWPYYMNNEYLFMIYWTCQDYIELLELHTSMNHVVYLEKKKNRHNQPTFCWPRTSMWSRGLNI